MLKTIKGESCSSNVAKNKKYGLNIWWFTAIVLTMIVGALVSGCSESNQSDSNKETANASSTNSDTTASQDTKKDEAKKEDTKITYDNFKNIKMGQSYDEVKALLGEGQESSSSDVGGIKTLMYEWQGSGMGNINVTFQDGVATIKAQAFLKDNDAQITMDKYNQIQNGMTYEQVKEILGEGELTSETKILDSVSQLYSYSNKDGSNATLNFSDGSVDTKSQINLK